MSSSFSSPSSNNSASPPLRTSDRLYQLAMKQRNDMIEAQMLESSTDYVPRDIFTGQRLFEPVINPVSDKIASKIRPQYVPIEDQLQHRGREYESRAIAREHRDLIQAQKMRESKKISLNSEKILKEKEKVIGKKIGSKLNSPIGNVRSKVFDDIDQPTFHPKINDISLKLANATHGHVYHTVDDVVRVDVPSNVFFLPSNGDSLTLDDSDPPVFTLNPNATSPSSSVASITTDGGNSSAMYERTQLWAKQKARHLEVERKKQDKAIQSKCSFKPEVKTHKSYLDKVKAQSNQTILDRNLEWQKKKEQRLEIERKRKEAESLVECSFAPNRVTKANATQLQFNKKNFDVRNQLRKDSSKVPSSSTPNASTSVTATASATASSSKSKKSVPKIGKNKPSTTVEESQWQAESSLTFVESQQYINHEDEFSQEYFLEPSMESRKYDAEAENHWDPTNDHESDFDSDDESNEEENMNMDKDSSLREYSYENAWFAQQQQQQQQQQQHPYEYLSSSAAASSSSLHPPSAFATVIYPSSFSHSSNTSQPRNNVNGEKNSYAPEYPFSADFIEEDHGFHPILSNHAAPIRAPISSSILSSSSSSTSPCNGDVPPPPPPPLSTRSRNPMVADPSSSSTTTSTTTSTTSAIAFSSSVSSTFGGPFGDDRTSGVISARSSASTTSVPLSSQAIRPSLPVYYPSTMINGEGIPSSFNTTTTSSSLMSDGSSYLTAPLPLRKVTIDLETLVSDMSHLEVGSDSLEGYEINEIGSIVSHS